MQTQEPCLSSEVNAQSAQSLLWQWLQSRLSETDTEWLHSQLTKIIQSNTDRDLHITLGLIPRQLGRQDLHLSSDELSDADDLAPGWYPVNWTVDTTARLWVLCHLIERGDETFGQLIKDLCRTADLAESIALYSGLPLYPHSSALDQQVSEGLRSNIKAVFEAIAHNNPYPALHFDENRWNHMVLKALFVGSWLSPIVGIDKRANATLANTLCDYAHERWAAGRDISYELWRCVGPFVTAENSSDLEKVIDEGNAIEIHAALLALSHSSLPEAKRVVKNHPAIWQLIESGELNWMTIEAVSSLETKKENQEQTL